MEYKKAYLIQDGYDSCESEGLVAVCTSKNKAIELIKEKAKEERCVRLETSEDIFSYRCGDYWLCLYEIYLDKLWLFSEED